MKMLAVVALALLPAQDDVEAKKKRLGELLKQMNQIQSEADRILRELSGGDFVKREAILREAAEKHAPEMAAEMERARTASNERHAATILKTFAAAQADFRSNDRDENRLNDFWVADVSGLYRVDTGIPIRLIERAAAAADAKPCVPLDQEGKVGGTKIMALEKPSPKAGYWFAVVEKYEEKGIPVKYNEGNGRNPSRFAMCAYPAEHEKSGRLTFLIDEGNTVWKKDTGGKPVTVFPEDPRQAGWTKSD
jgi:hypothetical protein